MPLAHVKEWEPRMRRYLGLAPDGRFYFYQNKVTVLSGTTLAFRGNNKQG
ncbi:hypothetical protein [uncultured Hymenobacter sp.]